MFDSYRLFGSFISAVAFLLFTQMVRAVDIPTSLAGSTLVLTSASENSPINESPGTRSFVCKTESDVVILNEDGEQVGTPEIRITYKWTPDTTQGRGRLVFTLHFPGAQSERMKYTLVFSSERAGTYSGDDKGSFVLKGTTADEASAPKADSESGPPTPKTFVIHSKQIIDDAWYPQSTRALTEVHRGRREARNQSVVAVADTGACFIGLKFNSELTVRDDGFKWFKATLVLKEEREALIKALMSTVLEDTPQGERRALATLEFCTLEAFHTESATYLLATPRAEIPFKPSEFDALVDTQNPVRYTITEVKALIELLKKAGTKTE